MKKAKNDTAKVNTKPAENTKKGAPQKEKSQGELPFKKALYGYDPEEVAAYIEEMSATYDSSMRIHEGKLSSLKEELLLSNRERDSYSEKYRDCKARLDNLLANSAQPKVQDNSADNTFITEYQVSNPAIFGKSIKDIRQNAACQFVISRVWKDGRLIIPTSETILEKDDHLLVISGKKDVESIKALFGHQENVDWNKKDIDWNAIDSQLVSSKVLVTKPEHNGARLGDLRLRNSYGINITRVNRAGIDLLPSRSLRLQLGDKLTIVGEARAIDNVSKILGNEAKSLKNPNLISIFIGIILGLILGSIPIALPGISMPVKLGIAGGPIIVGILMGSFGPHFHIATYTTRSANLMLRQLGLTIYLAGLGLSAGAGFFETVFTWEGLKWVAISLSLSTLPVLAVGFAAAKIFKTDYADNIGMLCGSMANPFALDYAYTDNDGEDPAVAYATVYPAGIFLRVISAQLMVMLLG